MKSDNHDRARRLLLEGRVEGISDMDRHWLNAHLALCSDCSREADAVDSTIQSIRGFSIVASPDLTRRTSLAVRRRATELEAERSAATPVWIAAALSSAWLIVTAPYVWSAFAWLGRLVHAPNAIWQATFLMWWFMPATVIAAVAAWRSKTVEPIWEQQ